MPGLTDQERIFINKFTYRFGLGSIERGDTVVFEFPGDTSKSYIKRVIGLPGDRVACCNAEGQVTVNGVPLSESSYLYPGSAPSIQKFAITVPAGRLWVMGDHRLISYDSRGHRGDPGGGTIPESGVLGRAFVIIWPPSQWGFLNIPATFEQPQLNASAAAGGNAAAGGSSTALEAALDNGTPIRPATSSLPLALGFIGAVPITWLQRRLRLRRNRRLKP
jgi:signal peptidase I